MPTIKNRRGTKSQWAVKNPILSAGEIGVELDTNKFKVGNGVNAWNSLPYFSDDSLFESGRLSEASLDAVYGKINESYYDLRRFGNLGKGEGELDITSVITYALSQMPPMDPAWGGAKGTLVIPPGRYRVSGGILADSRVQLWGSGVYSTVLYQDSGVTDDMVTLGDYASIAHLTLNGRRTNPTDALVLNGSYASATNIRVTSAGRDGVSIGKNGNALLSRLHGLVIRQCLGYGIAVKAASGSTDGQWSAIDVGTSGLSGIRISTGAQNLMDVHTWGNGLESSTDNHGIFLDSQSVVAVGLQAETNLGSGIHLGMEGSGGHVIAGIKSWGNVSNGVRGYKSNRNTLQGAVYNNGVANTSGTTSTSYAGVFNDGGVEWDVDLAVWDEAKTVSAGSYPSGMNPTFPFPGRPAQTTQSYAYAEGTGSDWNRISGMMRKERTRSGNAVLNVGSHNNYSGAQLGDVAVPNLASAATVTIPSWIDCVNVTGTTQITNINGGRAGRMVTLIFTDAAPGGISDGNVKLAGNFTPAQNGTITLVFAGDSWREISRSAN